jgi:hypothetical protein
MKRLHLAFRVTAFVALIALCLTGQTKKPPRTLRDKANSTDLMTPGLVITINSAAIASNSTLTSTGPGKYKYTYAARLSLIAVHSDITTASTRGLASLLGRACERRYLI